jgi:hypothetical protein
MEVRCQCQFVDPLALYKKIFPNNGYSSFDYFAHNREEAKKDQGNEFLELLHRDTRKILDTLYNPKASDNDLTLLVFNIHEITDTLQLKQSSAIKYKSDSRFLVWPDKFSKSSWDNLRYISKNLASFAFYKVKGLEVISDLAINFRLPDAGATKIKNMEAMDQITLGIDKYL